MGKKGASKAVSVPVFDYEKKLRPVYDALEASNAKSSLKLLVGYVTKYGRLPVLLALQALSLQRTGKNDEALELVRELLAQEPTDTTVMSPITLVLQALGQPKQITLMYENALKKNPKNQEFMMQVFTAYGREHNFQRQQQIAMQLYTNFKEHKFLFWSAICWMLQGGPGDDVVATHTQTLQFLHLAYMMIMRELPKDTPLMAEQCGLVIRLLVRQNKVQEAIDIAHGPYGKEFYQDDIERRRLLINLYSKLQNWTKVRDIYLDLITGENPQPSDFHYLCSWIQSELRLGKVGGCDVTKVIVPKVETLLLSLQQREKEKPPPQRGPFLASCELYSRLEPSDFRNAKLLQSIINYSELFGTKSCFFDDIRQYLDVSDQSSIHTISKALQNSVTISKQPTTQYYLEANIHQIALSMQVCDSKSLEETAKKLFGCYVSSLACATGNLEPTERGIGDIFLQLACSVLLELFQVSRNRSYLIDAVLALEYGLEHSRFNFQFKLLLVRLYAELGGMRRALQIYESLSVKQIQLDSMSHIMLHDAVRDGYWDDAKKLCSQVLQFHVQYQAEEQDLLARAFRVNNFTKVLEFEELRLRLANSHQAVLCGTELRHLNLVTQPDKARSLIRPVTLDIANLRCNEDFSVILSWHHPSKPFWSSVLNRPPPSVLPSSFELPFEESLAKSSDGYVLGSFFQSFLVLRNLVEVLLFAVIQKNTEVLQNNSLPALVEKMGLVGAHDSFRSRHWRLGLACFETARLFAEALIPQDEDDANWDPVIPALESLASQVSQISKEVANLGTSEVRDLALFLSHGGHWLTVCLQVWFDQIPKKKGKKVKISPKLAALWEKLNALLEATISCYDFSKAVAVIRLSIPDVLPHDPSPAAKLSAEIEPAEEKKIEIPSVSFSHDSLFPIEKPAINLFFARMQSSTRKSFEGINSVLVLTLALLFQLKTLHK